ncbi:MAG TPA: TIR domain-containing protein [Steroidobacteraceae bacterium]|nr:TIR domain-containing protein [Steroidobacteraceae bacterium]
MAKSDQVAELIRLKWDETERSADEARRFKRDALRAEHEQRGTSSSAGRWLDEARAEIAAIELTARQCLADLTNDEVVPGHARDDNYWKQLEETLPARATARLNSTIETIVRDAETHGHLTGGVQLGMLQLLSQHRANIRHDLQTRARALRIQQGLRHMSSGPHTTEAEQNSQPNTKKIFIVHGRILAARHEIGLFARSLGLEPLNFDDLRGSLGGTPTTAEVVAKGMEIAHGVIVLLAAEEFATLRSNLRIAADTDATANRWQARPNVIFEAGMAFNRDRKRVVFVAFGSVGLFSDIDGIQILRPTNDPSGHRNTLRSTLIGMGCAVDSTSSDWMRTGDFESWIPSAEGLSLDPQTTFTVSDGDAGILLRGWVSQLAVAKSGQALSFAGIAAEAGVSADQVQRTLKSAVEGSGTRWQVREIGTTVAILGLAALPPMPRRPDRFGGGY